MFLKIIVNEHGYIKRASFLSYISKEIANVIMLLEREMCLWKGIALISYNLVSKMTMLFGKALLFLTMCCFQAIKNDYYACWKIS